MTDLFASVKLHHTLVGDWGLHDPVSLTNLFIGSQAHWKGEWVRKDRNQFGLPGGKMKPIEIEREILASVPIAKWGRVSPHGKPYYQHMLTLIKLMFPKTDITDTLADVVMFFCLALSMEKKILNIIGAQNMSKTAGMCRIAFVTMFINPEFTRWTIANPFDNVADSGVWGEILILWEDLAAAWPAPNGCPNLLFPTGKSYADRRIEFIPDRPRVARMELRNIKHTGKGKGAKARKGDKNEDKGVFGEIVDEINEIDNPAFLTRFVNTASQGNYFALTGQNFKDTSDMGGQITEPDSTFGGAADFEALDIERDLFWHSIHAGVTLRLDGHKSANILAGRKIYSYLFHEADRLRIRSGPGGDQSASYFSQVRSFPITGASNTQLLSTATLNSSRHTDQVYMVIGKPTVVGFCDPAFGGRDNAVLGSASFAKCKVTMGDGSDVEQELFVVTSPFIVLSLVNGAEFNEYWSQRFNNAGVNTNSMFRPGDPISFEDQIALQCREHCITRGIKPENFGYDFSMRSGIVTSMNRIVGFESEAFAYNLPPSGVPLVNFRGLGKLKEEDSGKPDSVVMCKNRVTELGMFTADMFLSKAVRGGNFLPTATLQMMRTQLFAVNGKYVIEDKADYKARWSGVSPDHRDTLFGLAGMAARHGFRASLNTSKGSRNSGSSLLDSMRKLSKFRKPTFKKI